MDTFQLPNVPKVPLRYVLNVLDVLDVLFLPGRTAAFLTIEMCRAL
jgi:hypothetical protein